MKIFLELKAGTADVLERVIRVISETYGHMLVGDVDEAEICMTNVPEKALAALNDNESVIVAMLIFPGDRHVKIAGTALARSFPSRVDIVHVIGFSPEDKEINIYLIEKGGVRHEDSHRG